MKNYCSLGLIFSLAFLATTCEAASSTSPEESAVVGRWVAAKFNGQAASDIPSAGLYVFANHDAVQLNGRNGNPLQLGDKQFTHGLYCHAISKIMVRLPEPAAKFEATIGIDKNENTNYGCGSVVFSVAVHGKKPFDSGVRSPTMPAMPVQIDLGGATEFSLDVSDAGDGIGCDQADWADAKVTLMSGKTLWLTDLPLLTASDRAYSNEPYFSFRYGGKPFAELRTGWKVERHSKKLDDQRTQHTLTYSDHQTGLVIRCEGVEYSDFPAVEWVVYFENTGKSNTPILEDIEALDTVLPLPTFGQADLHWSKGSVATFDDFMPQKTTLNGGDSQRLEAGEGRSSSVLLPFFNVEGKTNGAVVALGWSGDWTAEFANTPDGVTLKAGMTKTHLILHPGEKIRSPRMLLITYRGDRWRGQNLLRRFILAHHRPQLDGKPLVAPITWGNWGGTPAEIHLKNIQKIIDHQLPVQYYWIDAGWYGQGGSTSDWCGQVGNWYVNKKLYPEGMRPLSDLLRKSGRELMVWFEPERVICGTDWFKEHSDWILDKKNGHCLVNMGNPDALRFVTDFIIAKIDEFGLGCYRQDYNIDPKPYMQLNEPEDRQGMAEIRYIEGFYAFWDALLAKYPKLMLDNCAGGGRRIDLETVGRAIPMWRTDGPREPVAHQCHTYGLMAWVPLSATSQDREGNDYDFRSGMCSGLAINWDHTGDGPRTQPFYDAFPFAWAKKTLDQYVTFRHLYYGDYYPLTPYTQSRDQWLGWQLDCPEKGEGMVQLFRREESSYESYRAKLRGLEPEVVYTLTNLDDEKMTEVTGQELMKKGMTVIIDKQPGAAIILYKRKP